MSKKKWKTIHEFICGKEGATAKDTAEVLKKYNGLPPLIFGNPGHHNEGVYNGFITAKDCVDEKCLIHWPTPAKEKQPMGIMNLPMNVVYSAEEFKQANVLYNCRCTLTLKTIEVPWLVSLRLTLNTFGHTDPRTPEFKIRKR